MARDTASPSDSRELDDFDLFSNNTQESSTPTAQGTDLSSTMQAFHHRIQRKKREQEKTLSEAERLTRQRQLTLLRALVNIRKSLREVARIELGERFKLVLVADDYHGWPRLAVRVHDNVLPQGEYPFLRVTSHDRQQKGAIEIEFDPSQPTEILSMANESEVKRLPNVLKKCVRSFLDLTGDIVLEAERRVDDLKSDGSPQSANAEEFYQEKKTDQGPALSEDLFSDDLPNEDLLDALPTLDSIEHLPD